MAGNRKGFEEFILNFMGKLTKGGGNRIIYERLFKPMTDAQMEQFVVKLENGEPLSIWASSYNDAEKLNYENLLALSKEYGVEVMQRLVIYDEDTGIRSMTGYKAVIGTAELRKQRQMLTKKIGVAKNDYEMDDLTGQVMGDSRATGISQPEITVLRNLGLTTLANELYNVKGGDLEALKAYKADLITSGKTNTNAALRRGNVAKVLETAHFLFRGRHLDNNFNTRK